MSARDFHPRPDDDQHQRLFRLGVLSELKSISAALYAIATSLAVIGALLALIFWIKP